MQDTELPSSPAEVKRQPHPARAWLIVVVVIGIIGFLSSLIWLHLSNKSAPVQEKTADENDKSNDKALDISEASTPIKLISPSRTAPKASFTVAGSVEPNQQQLQQITPLVSGRVENVFVALGDKVNRGTLLMQIDSPQVAEQHGKLHEAETRARLARINLNRVQQAANKVSVLKAKASLIEAEATLKRTKLLVESGLSAAKDLVSAQAEFERATADYNFQKDISLNREVADAKAELQTAETEVKHLKDSLQAYDAPLAEESSEANHPISRIELHSPIAGTIIERFVNPGAGFEQGKPLLTIANTSVLWVIANVPESQMVGVQQGTNAQVKIGDHSVSGKVSYIDPRLNEDTRTSRVRIEISNPDNKIQVGTFAEVAFKLKSTDKSAVFVPEAAVQTVDNKSVVFVKDSAGKFELRNVQVGPSVSGMMPVSTGLDGSEKVAADGSFILKSKLLKEQFGDSD